MQELEFVSPTVPPQENDRSLRAFRKGRTVLTRYPVALNHAADGATCAQEQNAAPGAAAEFARSLIREPTQAGRLRYKHDYFNGKVGNPA